MASSKLLTTAMSASFRRLYRVASSPLLPPIPRRLPAPFLSARFCSAAATATKPAPEALDVAYSAVAAVSAGHPWPEWGYFLEKLRTRGYFERPLPPGSDVAKSAAGDGETTADPYVLRDQNRVKNACLKFARERFDLLRLGSR